MLVECGKPYHYYVYSGMIKQGRKSNGNAWVVMTVYTFYDT